MRIIEITRMALTALAANKLRSILTMTGIIIGNFSVIALVGIAEGTKNYTLEKLESFGPNRFIIFPSTEDSEGINLTDKKLVLSDADVIKLQAPAVKEVAPVIALNLKVNYLSRQSSTLVIGTTKEFLYVRNFVVAKGRFFDTSHQMQNAQVIILGPDVAKKLFGDSSPLGKEIQINNISFEVIGVMKAKGSFGGENEDDAVYLPITTMSSRLYGKISPYGIPIHYIQVSAQNKESIKSAVFQVTNILTRLHGRKDFSIVANKSFQELVKQITSMMSAMLVGIASISLLTGGIGIMNVMLVSVNERTQEIGIRKAVGATQNAILLQFLIEAMVLSLIGGVTGTLLGISSIAIIQLVTPLKPTVPFAFVLFSVSISGAVGLLFGVLPARRAAKLDPIVALQRI